MIPPILSFDLWYPRVGAERGDASHLVLQSVPSVAGGIDNCIVVGMQAVGEEPLLKVEPDSFDRVQLRESIALGRVIGREPECELTLSRPVSG